MFIQSNKENKLLLTSVGDEYSKLVYILVGLVLYILVLAVQMADRKKTIDFTATYNFHNLKIAQNCETLWDLNH